MRLADPGRGGAAAPVSHLLLVIPVLRLGDGDGRPREPRVEAAEALEGAPQRGLQPQGQAVVGQGVAGPLRLVADPPQQKQARGALRHLGRLFV